MKKTILLTVFVLIIMAFSTTTFAHTEDAPYSVILKSGQTDDLGEVLVWNDSSTLYVKFVSTGACLKNTHVAVATSLADIPQTKKGNPIPGQFEYSDPHACVQEYTYEIPLAWSAGTTLNIAAHAATGVEEVMWVFSDGDESFTAYTGPGTAGYPCEQGLQQRSGTATAAWQHSAWSSVTSQFSHGTWIWEAFRAVDPICGTVVDFEETFDVPGEFIDGTLWVTADNGYEAYLNGTLLLTDGLNGDWRNSPLTESFVTTAQAAWSSVEMTTFLQLTGNTLSFKTANEYFNTDDGHGAAGTFDSNPGGLIYEAMINYYADGETAWGEGSEFPGKNWGMYFNYTVQKPPLVIGSWDTARGDLSAFASTDAFAEARQAINDEYSATYDISYQTFNMLSSSLNDVDVAIFGSVKQNESGHPISSLSLGEQAALHDYVEQGGCAVLLTDGISFNPGNDSLTAPFDLTTAGGFSGQPLATISAGFTDESTYKPNYPGYYAGAGSYTAIANFAGGQVAGVMGSVGSGKFFAFSDINMFWNVAYDIGGAFFADNAQFFLDVLDACSADW